MKTLLWILGGVCIVCALILVVVGVSTISKQTKEENQKKTEKARAARWKENGSQMEVKEETPETETGKEEPNEIS